MSALTNEQTEAVEAMGNVLLVASAGTGKTTTLVNRVLNLIVHKGFSIERIVMVTFTEAAATEMRRRIGECLEEALAGAPGSAAIREQLFLLPYAQIGTIHGFCLRLIREHAVELGLDPGLRVLDENQTLPMSAAVLDALFVDELTAPGSSFKTLVKGFGRGSVLNVREWILTIHRHVRSLESPAKWFAHAQASAEQDSPESWWGLLRTWAEDGVSLLENGQEHPPDVRLLLSVLAEFAGSTQKSLDGVVRAIADAAEGWKGLKIPRRLMRLCQQAEFLRGLVAAPGEPDPIQQDWDQLRGSLRILLGLTEEFGRRFEKAKHEAGGLDFADQEQFALKLLRSEDGSPTSSAKALRKSVDFVFVDECQDLNEAQDTLIRMISREGIGANRFLVGDVKQSIYRFRRANPAIFQRYLKEWGGDPTLGRVLPLTENFRSHEGIIDFVNSVFTDLMQASVGGVNYGENSRLVFGAPQARAFLARTSPTTGQISDPVVSIHWFSNSLTESLGSSSDRETGTSQSGDASEELMSVELEARLVASRLRTLKENNTPVWDERLSVFRPMEWSDVLILMRSCAGRASVFSQELGLAGIPVEVSGESFLRSREIQDIIQMLRLLDNPFQDIPLAAVLRSPMAGLALEDLAEARLSKEKGTLWEALEKWCEDEAVPKTGGRQKACEFLVRYRRWRALLRQTSLHCCVDRILRETGYEAWLAGEPRGQDQLANLRKFRVEVRRFSEGQHQGLYHFLRFVDLQEEHELEVESAPSRVGGAARLMSIHRSKGLEAPVVVLAGLGKQFNKRSIRAMLLITEAHGLTAKLPSPDGLASYDTIGRWAAERKEGLELLGEELRLLYVALTRARDRLELVGELPRNAEELANRMREGSQLADELQEGNSVAHWLILWLCSHGVLELGSGARRGANELVQWTLHGSTDLATPRPSPLPSSTHHAWTLPPEEILKGVREAMEWRYPLMGSTVTRSKVSVTQLRKAALVLEEWPAECLLFPDEVASAPPQPGPAGGRVSAARIGSATHAVLESCDLANAVETESLRVLVDQLVRQRRIHQEEGEALNLQAIQSFWQGEIGRSIVENKSHVRRELSFTLKLDRDRIEACDLSEALPGVEPGDFATLQGAVDLAVLLPHEIWILDFKTDRIPADSLVARAERYRPQLRLYSEAMSRIYHRPVARVWLHFLELNRTIDLGCGTKQE